ncbi:serum response factor-binding protein 1 [Neodiprion virginianus]|uniref:serum response factor-binding protein 1 n=1 Tax=Neodiprion virginianus TaxID=2961670 RepID=UPI001EE6C604|nr:serum response factor-binding protein 1 [Neodiprion virginianus]
MSKIEINNEIVLMRHCVRRARLHIIRKLIRQAGMLRSKKGDDKRLEKYKKKADKLCSEVAALKKLAEDEVTKFAITNSRSMGEILSDEKSGPEICVMVRLANNKVIADRVVKFKEKFPNYEDQLGPGKRKLYKMQRKAGKTVQKHADRQADRTAVPNFEQRDTISRNSNDSADDEAESVQTGLEIVDPLPEKTECNEAQQEPNETADSDFMDKIVNTDEKQSRPVKPNRNERKVKSSKEDKLRGISVTSREATVKSFTEFLEGNDAEKISPIIEVGEPELTADKIVLEKEVDSFFVTENGEDGYLSVVVPKSKVMEGENEDDNATAAGGRKWKNFGGNARESNAARNGRFFDKIDGSERRKPDRSSGFKARENRPDNGDARKRSRVDFHGGDNKATAENMHPSWAAKKKQQEILKLGFQGKKIVFDDA